MFYDWQQCVIDAGASKVNTVRNNIHSLSSISIAHSQERKAQRLLQVRLSSSSRHCWPAYLNILFFYFSLRVSTWLWTCTFARHVKKKTRDEMAERAARCCCYCLLCYLLSACIKSCCSLFFMLFNCPLYTLTRSSCSLQSTAVYNHDNILFFFFFRMWLRHLPRKWGCCCCCCVRNKKKSRSVGRVSINQHGRCVYVCAVWGPFGHPIRSNTRHNDTMSQKIWSNLLIGR